MSKKHEDQFEHDELIDSLYKDSAGEQPPTSLDNLILAKARGQTAPAKGHRKARWHVPVVLTLVPALALGLVIKMGNFGLGDGPVNMTGSNVYETDEFVLHIPESEADAIARPEKPDFSQLSELARDDTRSLTSGGAANPVASSRPRAVTIAKAETEVNLPVAPPNLADRESAGRIASAAVATTAPAPQAEAAQEVINAPTEEGSQLFARQAEVMTNQDIDASADQAVEEVIVATEQNNAAVSAMRAPLPAGTAVASKAMQPERLPVSREENFQDCPARDQRNSECPDIYQPVCAERDTGVRCVMAPCSGATETISYENSCAACADENVYGYFAEGACEELNILP